MLADFSLTMVDGTSIEFMCEDPEDSLVYQPEVSDSPLTWEKLRKMDKNLRLYGTTERDEIHGFRMPMRRLPVREYNPSPYQGMHHIAVLGHQNMH